MSGSVHRPTVEAFAKSAYVIKPHPKSTDGPEMIDSFEAAKRSAGFAGTFEDELATACAAVARSLGVALRVAIPDWRTTVHELLPSGGGTENECIMHAIRNVLTGSNVRIVEANEWTIAPAAKEAVAFALLGAATLDRFPSNVPSVTGAKRGVVLGSITPKP